MGAVVKWTILWVIN